MRAFFFYCLLLVTISGNTQQKDIRIVFTSDVHFGLKKAHFRNSADSVTSLDVNKAMSRAIHSLGKVDYIIITGDIANREEVPLQSSADSWKQFLQVYQSLNIPLLLVPGNHDISNAIGYYKPMQPEMDASGLVGIYNIIHPGQPKDTVHFKYALQDLNYSRDIGNIHFLFITLWPDSVNRTWIEKDLEKVSGATPVFIFVHDPPEGDPKHFTNPDGQGINATDKFEDLLPEVYNPGYEKDWDSFLKKHPNIKGYFHGHSNYNEFYTYMGVDSTLSLSCFRADSPMKGKYSSKDERLLSFQVITIHPAQKQVEIKECLWNAGEDLKWGDNRRLNL